MNFTDPLTDEDLKWLNLVREREMFRRRTRPLPSAVQSRLRSMGLVDLRKGELILTGEGHRVLAESRK